MIKEAIGVGETVIEAQEDACKKLGVETHDAEFEILEMPEKKKFGLFGGNPAKVRAFIKQTPTESAKAYLRSVLDALQLQDIQIESREIEEGVEFDLSGDNVGAVIGRRGETLDALQYLTGLVANHVDNAYFRVTLNIGDYREKREKTLDSLGRKLAFKTLKSGRKNFLEPMNPYERRIIHTAVQKINGVISWSEGENINRHVVIGLDPKVKRPRNNFRGDRNNNRKPYNNNRKPYEPRTQQSEFSTSNEDNVERKPKNEGGDFSLYGRIDK